MKKVLAFAVSICSVACLWSCGPTDGAVVGHWKGDTPIPTGQGNDLGANIASSLAGALTIDFRADHTFTMHVIVPVEGTWQLQRNEVVLTFTKAMGEPANDQNDKPGRLVLSADEKSLTGESESNKIGGDHFRFVKEGPPEAGT